MSAGATRALFLAVSPGEIWAALCEEDALVELRLWRASAAGRVGEIHLGRVVALKPDLPAALIDLGLARPAFLSAEDATPGRGIADLAEGQAVIVQVMKEARGGKATGVTLRPRLAGQRLDWTPARPGVAIASGLAVEERQRLRAMMAAIVQAEEGVVLRRAAEGADAATLAAEAAELRERWQGILAAGRTAHAPTRLDRVEPPVAALFAGFAEPPPQRIVVDDRAAFAEARGWLTRHHPALAPRLELHLGGSTLFEREGIAGAVEGALAPHVALTGGGALLIETSAAATLIDVDSGGAPILPTNLAAAAAVARHIRLRNLAGPIVIDFIAMKRRQDRARVAAALADALAADPAAPQLLGWTRLGHMEVVRPRRAASLAELLFERDAEGGRVKTALTVALEALRRAAREAAAAPGRPLALRVGPEVAATLTEGAAAAARRDLEERLGRKLAILAEPGRPRAAFDIGPR